MEPLRPAFGERPIELDFTDRDALLLEIRVDEARAKPRPQLCAQVTTELKVNLRVDQELKAALLRLARDVTELRRLSCDACINP
ncbi:MAG: hypothetical protein HYV09_09115 [Deltaproteobacteria bacterium]|nr:hypothetical protein [Deltaproteobacteria bacterium]